MKTLTIVLTALLISGCNTMAGLGKDIEKLGNNINKSATK